MCQIFLSPCLEEVCGLYNLFINIVIRSILVIVILASVLRHYKKAWLPGSADHLVSEDDTFNN